jgi:hypothetical protein
MKEYPTIEYYGDNWGIPVIAFDKLDGSNLRFEYSHKRGFYKFGTRNVMIDRGSDFGFAIDLFKEKYNEGLEKVFKSKDYRSALSFVCFAELHGKFSEFGKHDFQNDKFDITLFDIAVYKKGFIHPREFVKNFSHLGIPRIVYEGNLNMQLVNDVKADKFDLTEGVICKGVTRSKKGNDGLYYCKIKTDEWFRRLRARETFRKMKPILLSKAI